MKATPNSFVLVTALSLIISQAHADPVSEPVKSLLTELGVPASMKTEMRTISPDLIEISVGKDVIYATPDLKHLMFNATVIEREGKKNLTQQRVDELSVIDVKVLKDAKTLRFVNGTGEHMMYVFTDPLCPYCRKAESVAFDAAGKLTFTDTTMVMIPVALPIHPQSAEIIEAIFCSTEPEKAWQAALKGDPKEALKAAQAFPKKEACDEAKKVNLDNLKIMDALDVNATPSIFNDQGKPMRINQNRPKF